MVVNQDAFKLTMPAWVQYAVCTKRKKVIKCVISLQFATMEIFRPRCSNKTLFTKVGYFVSLIENNQGSDILMINDYS